MYKLVLIRHGESTWNLENRFTGWTDVDLTEKGVREAKSAGQVLKEAGYTHLLDWPFDDPGHAVEGCGCVINATSLGLGGGPGPDTPWRLTRPEAVAMDMVYKPLDTAWLQDARAHGLRTVDWLEMLICQATPSYRAFFGADPPKLDVRSIQDYFK